MFYYYSGELSNICSIIDFDDVKFIRNRHSIQKSNIKVQVSGLSSYKQKEALHTKEKTIMNYAYDVYTKE